jgi:hypothetical protein
MCVCGGGGWRAWFLTGWRVCGVAIVASRLRVLREEEEEEEHSERDHK